MRKEWFDMSKKKKNIRRKKSNNLLKGVAAAGAVVGGGTIFAGNNAVYAAELDDETQVSNLSESQASTSSYMSESLYICLNHYLKVIRLL